MTAELLAHNVAAHWMQAGAVAGAAWLGGTVVRRRGSGFLLKYWQAVLLALLLAPWIQPWQPVAATPARGLPPLADMAPGARVADVSVAGNVIALPAERWSVDPWTGVLALLAAGMLVRLAWLGLGLMRLSRLARAAHRVAPPEPAREFLAQLGMSAAFVQPPDVRMPCSFGLFRPTVVLPAAFDRLEPPFQRGIVCHELLHLKRRDFLGAMVEEVVSALLWFHPWVWLIRRRIRLHREQVVDAAVVRCTGDRHAYVRCLVALAGHPRALALAAPMLRSTELRARTDALFEKEGRMSKRRSAVLAMGLCAALGATVWTAAATVPLGAATAVPSPTAPSGAATPTVPLDATATRAPLSATAATVPAGTAPAMVPLGSPAPVPPSLTATSPPGAAAPGPAAQAPGAGQPATVVQPLIFIDLTRPGAAGRSRFRGREGELMLISVPDAGSVAFVPRIRDDAQQVVTVTVFELDDVPHREDAVTVEVGFDLDSVPHRELGAVDVAVGGDPVTFQASVPFEIAVPRIGLVASPASPEEPRIRAQRLRERLEAVFQQALGLRGAGMERTMAALEELQQALADLSGLVENDEATAPELMEQFAELQGQFAVLQEQFAELQERFAVLKPLGQ